MRLPKEIAEPLLIWYRENARDLPWRRDITPYRVWVSEIMLQQTRVEAVKPYFERFMRELPDVRALAEVEEERLLKLWEGLGYYSRARNLQKAARQVCEQYAGELPADYEELQKLCGIGAYTAGAIASIAYGIPVPAVDGNVLRVWARLTGDERDILQPAVQKRAREDIATVIPADSAAEFTQALIELGAVVCVPAGEARCAQCPLQAFCAALTENKTDILPVRAKAKPRKVVPMTVLMIFDGERVVLHKRPDKGLLAGMYEFYQLGGALTADQVAQHVRSMGLEVTKIGQPIAAKHIFTHLEWHMTGYFVRVDDVTPVADRLTCATLDELGSKYPVPSAHRAFREAINSLDACAQ
ncbi:MAG: A/G-specific adenine glycosylase [Clostridia bacterium]|nr:A/G-specific adenine glycosylase [Clostridia bacterium]